MPTPDNMAAQCYKRQVAKRFDRAATTYDEYGLFQQQVLQSLINLIPPQSVSHVLDIGTGTGQAMPLLSSQLKVQHLTGLDLSFKMLQQARLEDRALSDVGYVCADAECLPIQNGSVSMVFSSLALQWCLSLDNVFAELNRVLSGRGLLAFATLSQGSMPELKQAWESIGEAPRIHHYASHQDLLDIVQRAGFELLEQRIDHVTMWFDSPEQAIHSLTKVGASLVEKEGATVLSPSKWRSFLRQYAQGQQQRGVPLSYKVSFVLARKY